MRILIALNIILIILVIFLSLCFLYSIKNKKGDDKNMCINCDNTDDENDDIIEDSKYKQNKKIKTERVFVGKFITDEEYRQIPKNNRTGISNLIEDVNREYEHLKELNK
jgi:hypothetical protein